ncbi:MAG TPA: efflux RND transporter periplasmic adaptor subunit [Nitrospirota bacterium]|nr:efflux RND transporter periplasmic adaptor subunit [Nitrospirota bacterium]
MMIRPVKFARSPMNLACVLCVVLLAACSSGNSRQMPRTVPVVAENADQKDVPLQIRTIGNAEAYSSVQIKALVGGEVEGVYFQEGQDVKKGDLLFKIDARPYIAALKQAEGSLARDAAQARNAEEQAKRYAILVEKDYVSRDQYEQLRANADALAAAVEADKANVENARLQLEYCTIKSPLNGRAGSVLVNAGNVIKANDIPLTMINQIAPIYVTFSIPEQNLADVKKHSALRDLHIEAIIPGDEKRPAQGALTFIDNAVNTATGTIKLKGTFENRDRRLWPGQFMDVVMTLTTEPNRVLVPSQAVQAGQQGPYVYVVKNDMTAELRVVKPGRAYQNWTIIEQGVAAGEKVVTDGQLRLTPGSRVELKNEKEHRELATEAQNTQKTREQGTNTQAPKGK